MTERCVTTKLYISGEPVPTSEYALYFRGPAGVTELTSWKQLPDTETPVIAVPRNQNTIPTPAQFDTGDDLAAGWIHGSASQRTARGAAGRNAYRVDPHFEDLPTDDRTRAALSQMAHRPPSGHGVLITSPPGAGAEQAARLLATALAPTEAVFYARPATDRWTVEEIDEMVARPAYMKAPAGTRPIIVVTDADQMPDSVADRMLKILEEPPAGALFILTATTSDRLRPTIRGRLAGHIPIATLPPAARIQRYISYGLSTAEAAELDRVAADNVALGTAAAATKTVSEAVAAFDVAGRDPARPVISATTTAAAIETLAKKLAGFIVAADPDSDTEYDDDTATKTSSKSASEKEVKATVRMLSRHMVDLLVEDLRQRHLHQDPASAPTEALMTAVRSSARDARAAISAYVPPERALATLYTSLARLGV